jgi:hypothetical protein
MLKEMPKVGDVLIAKECQGIRQMGDMTVGKEYEVVRSECEGIAIIDDYEDVRVWGERYLDRFTLKVVEPVGLREMPKVGDVIIAINDDRGMGGIADITKGKEYPISKVTGNSAWFRDDRGFERIVSDKRLEHFTLKVVTPDKVGFIEINREYEFLVGKTRVVLDVDADGLAAVKALEQQSAGNKYKAELVDKIAMCQAEMDQLKSLLAEVNE